MPSFDSANPLGKPEPVGTRQRAVRLSDRARGQLEQALILHWQAEGEGKKLTRETRAQLLGVSIATAERVLKQQGVDRATLSFVFKNLGLPWSEDMCEPLPRGSAASQAPDKSTDPKLQQSPKDWAYRIFLASGLALALVAALYFSAQHKAAAAYIAEIDAKNTQFVIALHRGTTLFQRGDYEPARRDFEEAVLLARKYGNAGQLASSLRMAGDLALCQGSYGEAEERYEEAIGIWKALDRPTSLPALYEAVGDLKTRMKDYKTARQNLDKALTMWQKEGDLSGVAMAQRDLGTVSYEENNFGVADRLFKAALASVAGQSHQTEMRFDIYARQALVESKKGHPAAAAAKLMKCLDFWTQKKHRRWIATTHLQLGLVEIDAHQPSKASQYLNLSRKEFEAVGDRGGKMACEEALEKLNVTPAQPTSFQGRAVS